MLQLKNIKKDYRTAGSVVHALRGVNLRFRKNEFVSILGASGCGKTTLLNIVGGLDQYTSGDLVINGVSTKNYKDRDWDVYRNHRIGFVFQSYNLIPHQTVLANVELALTIAGISKAERRRRAKDALARVGLRSELKKRPNQLSGGQMQRVAIARALVNNPEILLADEPTGALDSTTSVQIMQLIREIAGERLVIMVTHNPEIAEQYSTRIVRLQDGLVISDSNPYNGEEESKLQTLAPTCQDVEIACPKCKQLLHLYAVDVNNPGSFDCPVCGEKFRLNVRKKQETSVEKGKKSKKANSKGKNRTSMSLLTSLGLSARNLASKKGRTTVTSIAGSIGVISVCLVLALSNGFNGYILKTQEDMLSSYPLEITETTLDMSAIISGMTELSDMPDLDKIGDHVYVNSFLTNIAQGMTVTNNLSNEYITYLESMDEELYTAIAYENGMTLSHTLFTQASANEDALSLSTLKENYVTKLSQQEEKYAKLAPLVEYLGAIYGKMPGTADANADGFGDYVLSQYEIIGEGSRFPQAANEAVFVVGSNNDVTDLTLAQLGIITEDEFMSLFPADDSEVDEDSKEFEKKIPFDRIIGKQFMLYYNDAVYTPVPEGEQSEFLFSYTGSRDELISQSPDDGVVVETTGVLRLKDDLNYGCLSSGLYMTEQLYNEYQAKNAQSKIVQAAIEQADNQVSVLKHANTLNEELSALTQYSPEWMVKAKELADYLAANADYFKVVAKPLESAYIDNGMGGFVLYGDSALRSLGGKASANEIKIYTDTFDKKEGILSHLDAWNDNHEKEDQVRYTDTVGTMMSMVETILDAITYVLVAFTAISLVVSSVMIGIITYVSVVERTKEIGVLRSLGARKKDIRNLFNAETFIIGLSSGMFGVVVTYLISYGVNALLASLTGIATLANLPFNAALIMVAVSVVLTLISGLIPAKAAANKDPVIALRTE